MPDSRGGPTPQPPPPVPRPLSILYDRLMLVRNSKTLKKGSGKIWGFKEEPLMYNWHNKNSFSTQNGSKNFSH